MVGWQVIESIKKALANSGFSSASIKIRKLKKQEYHKRTPEIFKVTYKRTDFLPLYQIEARK